MDRIVRLFTICLVCTMTTGMSSSASPTRTRQIMPGTPLEASYVVLSAEVPGPTVVVIGGFHGNEPAGYLAARKLCRWKIVRGTLVVLSDANKEAISRGVRFHQENLNRLFPGKEEGTPRERFAFQVFEMIRNSRPALLLTLHESIGYHRADPSRFGQTICYDFDELTSRMRRVTDRLNPSIESAKDRFLCFVAPYPTCPTYQCWARLRVPAASIETSKQLPIQTRIKYQLMAVSAFLDDVGVLYSQSDIPPLTPVTSSAAAPIRSGASVAAVPRNGDAEIGAEEAVLGAGKRVTQETVSRNSILLTIGTVSLCVSVVGGIAVVMWCMYLSKPWRGKTR